jgi:hypothetical protein
VSTSQAQSPEFKPHYCQKKSLWLTSIYIELIQEDGFRYNQAVSIFFFNYSINICNLEAGLGKFIFNSIKAFKHSDEFLIANPC